MNVDEFDYKLPESLIAQNPLSKRDQARLMVVNRKQQNITHDIFSNIDRYLPRKSQIILNNSKVIPARLLGIKHPTGAQIEVFLLKAISDYDYEVLIRPLKRLKEGDVLKFSGSRLKAQVINKDQRIVRFNQKNVLGVAKKIGHMPLPPYIKRSDKFTDRENYQTVYAKKDGSVAAPTAGLHFTKPLLNRLTKKEHDIHYLTLHINYGTFKPVEVNDITKHSMHAEEYELTKTLAKAIVKAKESNQKIVAVGTTSTRVLEMYTKNNNLRGSTNIFIYPGFKFKMVDILITNFHLPRSTLLMLVYAFGGIDLMKRAYQKAIKEKYRFYSYGDAMIIL